MIYELPKRALVLEIENKFQTLLNQKKKKKGEKFKWGWNHDLHFIKIKLATAHKGLSNHNSIPECTSNFYSQFSYIYS